MLPRHLVPAHRKPTGLSFCSALLFSPSVAAPPLASFATVGKATKAQKLQRHAGRYLPDWQGGCNSKKSSTRLKISIPMATGTLKSKKFK